MNHVKHWRNCSEYAKKDRKIIIPTYLSKENRGKPGIFIHILETFGAKFKKQFDLESYKAFYDNMGYENAEDIFVDGKIPCAIAIISK